MAEHTHNEHKADAPAVEKKEVTTETVVAETKATKTKASAKTETKKTEKKETKNDPTPSKPTKKKGTKATWVKKEKVKKDTKAKETQDDLSTKWKPVFWGRFGKKHMRTRNNPKFDKWRKPRGEDMQQRKDDGAVVDAGYRSPKALRGIHPSGYKEVMVFTKKDLQSMKPTHAARISGTIGRKKKIELIKFANEKKIWVLN